MRSGSSDALEVKTDVLESGKGRARVRTRSKQFDVTVSVGLPEGGRKEGRKSLESGSEFTDSLLRDIAGFDIEVSGGRLEDPLIIENVGFALGRAFRELHSKRKGSGSSSHIRSDGKKMCMFAMNLRNERMTGPDIRLIGEPCFDTEHLFAFFDGFSQGLESEFNMVADLGRGDKKKNVSFISKALGKSLENLLVPENSGM